LPLEILARSPIEHDLYPIDLATSGRLCGRRSYSRLRA
jgi:hypothetical protein